jgi:hypothetical protein
MFAYICVFVVITMLGLASILTRREAVIAAYLSLPLLILFSGTRIEIGWDWEAYNYLYEFASNNSFFSTWDTFCVFANGEYEPGFVILVAAAGVLGISQQFLIVMLIVVFGYLAHKRNFGVGIAMFVTIYMFYGYFHTFGIVRQGLAAAIAFYGISLERRERALAVVALACSIHFSIIPVAIFLYLVVRFVSNKMLLATIAFAWFASAVPLAGPLIMLGAAALGFERWMSLLDFSAATFKVGFSLVLVEHTAVAILYLLNKSDDRRWRLGAAVVVCRLFLYGALNDISIVWERFNSAYDLFYASACAYIIYCALAKYAPPRTFMFKFMSVMVFIGVSMFVYVRYDRLIGSDSRETGGLSHYDRFVNYRSFLGE